MNTNRHTPRGHKGIPRLRRLVLLVTLLLGAFASGQNSPADRALFERAEGAGVSVQLRTIATFRGVAPNGLVGIGLVTGLAGTGDTKKFLATQRAAINMLKGMGIDVDPTGNESKSMALVTLTAELPPFSTPGQRIDVTASVMGDCTSLRGGTLMFAPLRFPGLSKVYATVAGSISVGGYSSEKGGGSEGRGFTTVGKLTSGLVQESVPTQTTFGDKNDRMYLDLATSDAVTAARMENAIREAYPEFRPVALDAGAISLTLPAGMTSNTAQAKIGALTVMADTEAKIVIDERTGTVVIGGNVRVAPCAFAKGSLTIRVGAEPFVSQPASLSGGKTVVGTAKTLDVREQNAQIAVLRPNTTVADLAALFQALHLKADDVMNILKSLHEQGALKARLEIR